MRRVVILILLTAIAGFLAWFFSHEARQDNAWHPEQRQLSTVEKREGGALTFTNVRDWTYSDTEVLTEDWIVLTVSPGEIVRTWLYVDHFSSIHGIAHPFVAFEFADGTTLALSVEARREQHEEYSPIAGAFRKYELTYIWSTERDVLTRRLVHLDHPLLRYPLTLAPEESAVLLNLMADETNELAREPRFYNTITGNCMNLLAQLINTAQPGRLPYGIAWNLPGYADRYLERHGLIDYQASFETDLTAKKEAIEALATSSPAAFSEEIRKF